MSFNYNKIISLILKKYNIKILKIYLKNMNINIDNKKTINKKKKTTNMEKKEKKNKKEKKKKKEKKDKKISNETSNEDSNEDLINQSWIDKYLPLDYINIDWTINIKNDYKYLFDNKNIRKVMFQGVIYYFKNTNDINNIEVYNTDNIISGRFNIHTEEIEFNDISKKLHKYSILDEQNIKIIYID